MVKIYRYLYTKIVFAHIETENISFYSSLAIVWLIHIQTFHVLEQNVGSGWFSNVNKFCLHGSGYKYVNRHAGFIARGVTCQELRYFELLT